MRLSDIYRKPIKFCFGHFATAIVVVRMMAGPAAEQNWFLDWVYEKSTWIVEKI